MPGTLDGVRYSGRANRQRYEVVGEWSREGVASNSAATVEVADLRDKRNGDVFREGAYRVTSTESKRSVLLFGETAWSDAERLARDLETAADRRGGPPVSGLGNLLRF